MAENRLRWLMRLTLVTVVITMGVVVLGAYTRLTDAGLGCPDWPGCYGHMLVKGGGFDASKAWTEMIHRYAASFLSLLILAVASLSIFCAKRFGGSFLRAAILLIVLLVYQTMLGRWTVTEKLMPTVVSQHLLGGMALICLLWLIYLRTRGYLKKGLESRAKIARWPLVLALIIAFVQVGLGAWTSSNYAGLSCPNFPFCFSAGGAKLDYASAFIFPHAVGVNYEGGILQMAVRQAIQMVHRFGAMALAIYFPLLAIYLLIKEKQNEQLRRAVGWMIFFLATQLVLGVVNVIFHLPMSAALLHNLMAALLLCSLVSVSFYVFRSRRYYHLRVLYQRR